MGEGKKISLPEVLKMDSRKWKWFFYSSHRGGVSEACVTFVTLFFFFEDFPNRSRFIFAKTGVKKYYRQRQAYFVF